MKQSIERQIRNDADLFKYGMKGCWICANKGYRIEVDKKIPICKISEQKIWAAPDRCHNFKPKYKTKPTTLEDFT